MGYWKKKIPRYYYNKKRLLKENAVCKKHPKHKQSPGVCSICLCEKLSQLSNSSTSDQGGFSRRKVVAKSSSSSSSSSYLSSLSSSNASSYSSPRVELDTSGKSMWVFSHNVLKKSRSMAFVLQRRKENDEDEEEDEDEDDVIINGKNKSGSFWSKLLARKSKRLMHSRTTRERVIT